MKEYVSLILLAGGSGNRMQSSIPKQFLELSGKPLIAYSLELFSQMDEISEIIVTCDPTYREIVAKYSTHKQLMFALPGTRRQDSVYNGFKQISPKSTLVCIHDCARPLVTKQTTKDVLSAAASYGAATVAVPLKFTIKETDSEQMVKCTPNRESHWEVQTPQAARPDLLAEGFKIALQRQLTVTDDVSLIELQGLPVKLVHGSYSNIKITTPEDLILAESCLTIR